VLGRGDKLPVDVLRESGVDVRYEFVGASFGPTEGENAASDPSVLLTMNAGSWASGMVMLE